MSVLTLQLIDNLFSALIQKGILTKVEAESLVKDAVAKSKKQVEETEKVRKQLGELKKLKEYEANKKDFEEFKKACGGSIARKD